MCSYCFMSHSVCMIANMEKSNEESGEFDQFTGSKIFSK